MDWFNTAGKPKVGKTKESVREGTSDGMSCQKGTGLSLGMKDGTSDGIWDGIRDGVSDGIEEGPLEGTKDGPIDGSSDGPSDGNKAAVVRCDGDADGRTEPMAENDGLPVG